MTAYHCVRRWSGLSNDCKLVVQILLYYTPSPVSLGKTLTHMALEGCWVVVGGAVSRKLAARLSSVCPWE